jgi:mRNA interferase HicA
VRAKGDSTEFDTRAVLPDTESVTGAEFMRRVRKLGRRREVVVNWVPERGKGSHGTFYYGTRFTVVQNLNNELKKATLHTMLDQLGLTLGELLKGKE